MIRLAESKDTSQVKTLWADCFDDTPEFIEFYFNTCYQPENTLVAEENGRIVSCVQLLPYRMRLRGRDVPVSYVVGVATRPESRGRGLVRQLLQFTGELLRQRNISISILLPFQYDFYRKYGWEICYDLLLYKDVEYPGSSSKPAISPTKKTASEMCIAIDRNHDLGVLTKCYYQYMESKHGFILRTEKDWQKIIRDTELDNGYGYLYQYDNEIQGYVFYTIQDKVLTIRELVHLTPTAKQALLQLALSHNGQVETIKRIAPIHDTEYLSMIDSRGKLEKETFVMGRIHDPVAALTGIPYTGDPLMIQVTDPFYDVNNGCYRITQSGGRTTLQKTEGNPEIIVDIQTLNQMLWGYLSPEIAWLEGRLLKANERSVENLSKLFPIKYNYMTEVY